VQVGVKWRRVVRLVDGDWTLGTQTRRLVVEKRNVLRFRGVIEAKFFERRSDFKFDETSSIWNMSEIVKKKKCN
jgi:hypothetical protein